jgi:hypothetical protein
LESLIAQNPPAGTFCAGAKATQIAEGVYANVTDPDDQPPTLNVSFTWRLNADGIGGGGRMTIGDGIFAGGFKVDYSARHAKGGTITIVVTASDAAGNAAPAQSFNVTLDVCTPQSVIG